MGLPLIKHASVQTLSGGDISKLLNASLGTPFVLYALLAGTGLRIGEAFGLQVEHISPDFRTLSIRQSVWNGVIQSPKTDSAIREVDLNGELAELLKEIVGDRKNGLVFTTRTGKPLHQSNTLRRHLHPTLMGLDIEPVGFHAFRRFRVTHLRKQRTPEDLVRAWLGHSSSSITDRYSKVSDDVDYRRDVVEHVALGFDLPKLATVVNY